MNMINDKKTDEPRKWSKRELKELIQECLDDERYTAAPSAYEHKYLVQIQSLNKENKELQSKLSHEEETAGQLNAELREYKRFFEELMELHRRITSLDHGEREILSRYIAIDDPLRLAADVAVGNAVSTLYEYLLFELDSLTDSLFGIYNELVQLMCRLNMNYKEIDCIGNMDIRLHIEKNKKQSGTICKVLIKGYMYKVSGEVIKKALVEVNNGRN